MRLEEAEARYEALRERDRVIASLQSKQRMLPMFDHLLDEAARKHVDERLRVALERVRSEGRKLAIELAKAAFLELEIDDLARMNEQLRRFTEYLEQTPSDVLDACHDLLAFIRDIREIEQPPRRPTVVE